MTEWSEYLETPVKINKIPVWRRALLRVLL